MTLGKTSSVRRGEIRFSANTMTTAIIPAINGNGFRTKIRIIYQNFCKYFSFYFAFPKNTYALQHQRYMGLVRFGRAYRKNAIFLSNPKSDSLLFKSYSGFQTGFGKNRFRVGIRLRKNRVIYEEE